MGAMNTTTSKAPRTEAANAARLRKSQERAAAKLTTGGWVCFPPEKVAALLKVIETHDELTGWQA